MRWILFVMLIFYFHHHGTSISPSRTRWAMIQQRLEELQKNETFQDQLREHLGDYNQNYSAFDNVSCHFPCNIRRRGKPSETVHMLEPADIAVIGAMGDSITAGNGIRARTIVGSYVEFRGYSWSVGGKDHYTDGVITIPNIIKHYNPYVKGFATGTGGRSSSVSKLDVAHPGDIAGDMPGQAQMLVKRIRRMEDVDFDRDWKMVTIFIGGNDMCAYCQDKDFHSADRYIEHLTKALDILHKQLPRTLVNMVPIMDITHIAGMSSGPVCSIVKWEVCKCAIMPSAKSEVKELAQAYGRRLQELVASGRYDNREDFTVVYQPFTRDNDVPKLPNGDPDFSFFAPDCFHFSQRGHNIAATMLWNALFQPVGGKQTRTPYDVPLYCPEKGEYIATSRNSVARELAESLPPMSGSTHRGPPGWQVGLIVLGVGLLAAIIGVLIHRARSRRNSFTFESGERQRLLLGPI